MTKRIKLRTMLVGGLITLLFAVLAGKVYWVQVVNADLWSEKARELWSKSEKLLPVRGNITDRDGDVLAMDVPAYTVVVKPKVLQELKIEDLVISKLHLILGKPESEIRTIIEAKNKDGNYYEQREIRKEGYKVDKSVADRINNFKEELFKQTNQDDVGIFLTEGTKRYYPKKNLASHILGYLDKEGKAVMGLEASLDKELAGQEGEIKYERDGNGVILENGTVSFNPSHDGDNVKLTIDTEIQHYVEEAIKEAYIKYQPKSITAIAADPNTMEILGMANLPDFNPNEYGKAAPEDFYDHSIKSLYEPGSTFKIVTLSGAVQEGLFNPDEPYKSGHLTIGGWPIRDHNQNWGTITFLEGLKRSSNVAFVKLGLDRLKADRLLSYIKNFGFGEKTGIELQGESKGAITVNPHIDSEVATAAFGQGKVQVTPIQQVAAVAAAANGGRLLVPHLVKEVEDPVTKKVTVTKPTLVRQVISEKSSKLVGEYLEQVVSDQEKGTGKNAYIEGYRVAGKTGTAQKVINGKYSTDKYVVSFIGFAPVGNPKIVVYVIVDEPNDKYAGGGSVAAPVFRNIVLQSLRHMGVSPITTTKTDSIKQKEQTVVVPDLAALSLAQAKSQLKTNALDYEVVGKGGTVLQQIPKAGTAVAPNQRVYMLTEERSKLTIPDMKGLSLRDALEICSILQVRCLTEGEGFVTSQMLAKQNGENILKLVLAPPDAQPATSQSEEADSKSTKE